MVPPRSRWLLLVVALYQAGSMAMEEVAYSAFRETESLYQAALETEDCGQIDSARVVLQGLSRSVEPIPQTVADELKTGRARLGDYARRARRTLNKRWGELCRTPLPDCNPPPPVKLEELDAVYALVELTPDCAVAVGVAERLIGMSDPPSAPHTLKLLSKLRRARVECFP